MESAADHRCKHWSMMNVNIYGISVDSGRYNGSVKQTADHKNYCRLTVSNAIKHHNAKSSGPALVTFTGSKPRGFRS